MPAKTRQRFVIGCLVAMSMTASAWASAESICPAPRATCVLPAATRLADLTPVFFHTSRLEIGPASADACAEPLATCVQPRARVARLWEHDLAWTATSRSTMTVDQLLTSWADASHGRPAWTATEKTWLARRHQPWLSGVAIDAVVRLASSVNAVDLTRDFTWTIDASRGETTILHAVPKDDAQQLFCPQLRVELDPMTHALTAIDVADRTGTWRPIDLPWDVLPPPGREANTIVLTANAIEVDVTVDGLPPSPTNTPLLRFAAGRIELDITLPR